jgi:hypothetical protein
MKHFAHYMVTISPAVELASATLIFATGGECELASATGQHFPNQEMHLAV